MIAGQPERHDSWYPVMVGGVGDKLYNTHINAIKQMQIM